MVEWNGNSKFKARRSHTVLCHLVPGTGEVLPRCLSNTTNISLWSKIWENLDVQLLVTFVVIFNVYVPLFTMGMPVHGQTVIHNL